MNLKNIKYNYIFYIFVLAIVSCGKYMPTEIQKPVNLSFNSKGTKDVKIETKFVSSNQMTFYSEEYDSSKKRLLILFASQRCSACVEEHSEFKKLLDEGVFDKTKFEVISLMIAAKFSSTFAFQSVTSLMNDSGMDWPIGEDIDLKYFNMFCEGKTTPCSVVVEPSIGIVYTHNGIPDFEKLKNVLNK